LFIIIEEVFDGEDPKRLSSDALNLKFPMQLDDPDVNLYYSQLLMSFIRWVASGDNEIDRIITAAVRNYPPPAKYKQQSF
ncbi:MAG: hypothetical protein ACXQS5_04965, partial [Candidatus Methanospirareceae archaeon]